MSDRFEHKKSLGQHFLNSDVVPRWLCDAATIVAGETVLEIGPGTGALTKELLNRGARVIALEADQRAIDQLATTFDAQLAAGQLRVEHADARELDLSAIDGLADGQYKIVANIPYYLSGLLFRQCLQTVCQPNTLVFLVQKEVAKRICVAPERGEKESLLSLSVAAYGVPTYVKTVTKGHFTPPPKVDSGIIAINNISRNALADINEADFFAILHLGFGQKRKQLLGNLTKQYDRERLIDIFSTLGIDEKVRAEDIRLEMWLQLVHVLVSHS